MHEHAKMHWCSLRVGRFHLLRIFNGSARCPLPSVGYLVGDTAQYVKARRQQGPREPSPCVANAVDDGCKSVGFKDPSTARRFNFSSDSPMPRPNRPSEPLDYLMWRG